MLTGQGIQRKKRVVKNNKYLKKCEDQGACFSPLPFESFGLAGKGVLGHYSCIAYSRTTRHHMLIRIISPRESILQYESVIPLIASQPQFVINEKIIKFNLKCTYHHELAIFGRFDETIRPTTNNFY